MKPSDPGTPRVRDAATVLPLLAVFLLMPPVITLFSGAHSLAGVPLIVVYLFGVWLALIIGAALLARRLGPAAAAMGPAAGPSASGPSAAGPSESGPTSGPTSDPSASTPRPVPAGAQPDDMARR